MVCRNKGLMVYEHFPDVMPFDFCTPLETEIMALLEEQLKGPQNIG